MSDPVSADATACEIARAVAGGTAKAVAVVDAALARIAAAEPTVNAFTDIVAERAKKRAAEIDAGKAKGPLAGVPFAVKNLFDIAGLPTRAGSRTRAPSSSAASTWASTPTTSPAKTRTTARRATRTIRRA